MGLELTRKKRDLGEGWELGEQGLWESLPHIQRLIPSGSQRVILVGKERKVTDPVTPWPCPFPSLTPFPSSPWL